MQISLNFVPMLEMLQSADPNITLFLNQCFSPWLDSLMIYWSLKWIWLPLYAFLLLFLWKRTDNRQFISLLLLLAMLVLLSDQTASALFKPLFERLRPCHDPKLIPFLRLPDGCGGLFGFASSPAANTMAITVFFALLPAGLRSRKIWIALFCWSLLSGWSRVYLGMHFAGDILAGFAIGAFWASALQMVARRFRIFDEKQPSV